jgi:ferredoxin--NADP+ reductase
VTCIDCGACIDVCPVDAILPDSDLTPLTEPYREINAAYFADAPDMVISAPQGPDLIQVGEAAGPLKVAIVGSGPAACYAAEELLSRRDVEVQVTMFDRLPTPLGLVRYGVAPDHQRTKQVANQFGRTLNRKQLTLELNVEVGTHISVEELLDYHHAVIYATGASQGRRLEIPGEDLSGVHSATDFVGWYNGHPDHAHRTFDLSVERAVVIGNGNVALDVARILVSDVATLASTDIAVHALEALAASRVREVVVVGRRGPEHAAYTTPELLGLGQMPNLDIGVAGDVLAGGSGVGAVTSLKTRLASEFASRTANPGNRRIRLEFFRSPTDFLGENRVTAVKLTRTAHVEGGSIRYTDESDTLSCGLVLTSVGYRGTPIPGLPFRHSDGTIPNEAGRVIAADTGQPMLGAYVAGWVKRGPSGVIGTNKHCSIETVRNVLADFAAGLLRSPDRSRDELDAMLTRRQPRRVGKVGWKAIDTAERNAGRSAGSPRVKYIDIEGMLRAAGIPEPVSARE